MLLQFSGKKNVSAIYSDTEAFLCYSLKLSAIFKNQFLKWSPGMNVFFRHSLLALSVQRSRVPAGLSKHFTGKASCPQRL